MVEYGVSCKTFSFYSARWFKRGINGVLVKCFLKILFEFYVIYSEQFNAAFSHSWYRLLILEGVAFWKHQLFQWLGLRIRKPVAL